MVLWFTDLIEALAIYAGLIFATSLSEDSLFAAIVKPIDSIAHTSLFVHVFFGLARYIDTNLIVALFVLDIVG
jgi:hypothetical protein